MTNNKKRIRPPKREEITFKASEMSDHDLMMLGFAMFLDSQTSNRERLQLSVEFGRRVREKQGRKRWSWRKQPQTER